MIWVYGICDRPELPPPRRRGLAQAPLDGVREGDLLAVVSRHTHPPGDPALDALWVHERVVERIMADRAVLPMRFGSRLPDDDALRELLAARQQEFLGTLQRVRGRVEVSVRAMQQGGEQPSAAEPSPRGRSPPAGASTSRPSCATGGGPSARPPSCTTRSPASRSTPCASPRAAPTRCCGPRI